MTATTVLVLVLGGLLLVLLLAHRAEGTLFRAAVEYAAVAVLVLLLAFTPATRGASAGVAAGVTSNSASLGRLVTGAWRASFDRQAPATPAARQPTRKKAPATRQTTPPRSTPAPAPTARPDARVGVPLPLGVLGLVGLALAGLVAVAWRIRRLDRRDALALGLARLPRRRGRRARRVA